MVNLITTNCNLLEINCTFKLFSIIQNSNKEYSDVTIRRTKNEFKIDIKNHESQDFIFLLNQNKINAKIIQPKTPFFVTNLPNGISQSELSEGISSIYPNSSIRIFKSSNRCGQALIPTSIVQNCPTLSKASISTEGIPITIPPLPPIYFRPFKPVRTKYSPPRNNNQRVIPNPNSYASRASKPSAQNNHQLTSIESQMKETSTEVVQLKKQIEDLKSAQGHLEAKITNLHQNTKEKFKEVQQNTQSQFDQIQASLQALTNAFQHFTQQIIPIPIQPQQSPMQITQPSNDTTDIQHHFQNSKRAYSSSPIFQQHHPNIPTSHQPLHQPNPP